jgi:hypothetical protein
MKSALVALLLLCSAATAQELPDKPHPQGKQRILWLVPAYDVARRDDAYTPLSSREKLNLFAENSSDRFTIISATFDAAINQATNTPEGFGQGGEGYAKRYGTAVADKVTSDFLKTFLYPSLFKQDPRYFALTSAGGKYGKGKRVWYAMSRVFVTRGDNGNSQFNVSKVFGNASSAAMTNIWYPPGDRDVETTMVRFGSRMGVDMAANILKEFWSELGGRMFKRK